MTAVLQKKRYPSDLSFNQWKIIEPLIPPAKPGGRPREHSMKDILDAIWYKVKTGCQWRILPNDYPPWRTVYEYFKNWSLDYTWLVIHDEIVKLVRKKKGKNESPSAAIIDSQSVKTAIARKDKGYDGGKKVKGRKRHILVDTLGLTHSVVVHPANIHDSVSAKLVLLKAKYKMPRLEVIWADAGYNRGMLIWYVLIMFHWFLDIVERTKKEFEVLSHRWIVERTFAWMNNYRVLSKDYEYLTRNSENMIYTSMLHLMLRRLAK